MKKLTLIVLQLLFLLNPAQAYNTDRCASAMSHRGAPWFPDVSSTSEFTTSTGPCSLIGMRDQRKVYITSNIDNLLIDSARGGGEYVEALANLSGCPTAESRHALSRELQKNFSEVYFKGTATRSESEISSSIDRVIKDNGKLKKQCSITS